MVTNWATPFSHYKNRGLRWFLVLGYQFVFFCFQLFFSFLKIAFFKKGVQTLVFVVEREENRPNKNDNWNLWIWFFLVQKWPFCDAYLLSKKGPETPIFIFFWGVSAFWAKVSKKGNFEKPPKKRKNWLITEKLFFGIFAFWGGGFFFSCFFCFLCLFFLEGLRVRWGGPKGHLIWP